MIALQHVAIAMASQCKFQTIISMLGAGGALDRNPMVTQLRSCVVE